MTLSGFCSIINIIIHRIKIQSLYLIVGLNMKTLKILLLIVSLVSLSCTRTQITISDAIDFTADDIHGTSHQLFEYLDKGNHVLLKFNQFN